jgi:hypothetical protein
MKLKKKTVFPLALCLLLLTGCTYNIGNSVKLDDERFVEKYLKDRYGGSFEAVYDTYNYGFLVHDKNNDVDFKAYLSVIQGGTRIFGNTILWNEREVHESYDKALFCVHTADKYGCDYEEDSFYEYTTVVKIESRDEITEKLNTIINVANDMSGWGDPVYIKLDYGEFKNMMPIKLESDLQFNETVRLYRFGTGFGSNWSDQYSEKDIENMTEEELEEVYQAYQETSIIVRNQNTVDE